MVDASVHKLSSWNQFGCDVDQRRGREELCSSFICEKLQDISSKLIQSLVRCFSSLNKWPGKELELPPGMPEAIERVAGLPLAPNQVLELLPRSLSIYTKLTSI